MPAMPVRNVATRSARGNRVGAGVPNSAAMMSRGGRVGHIGGELTIVLGFARVEAVLVLQTDYQFINQWHTQSRHLLKITILHFRLVILESTLQDSGLRQTSRRPAADYRGLAGDEAAYWHLENKRGNVFAADAVGLRIGECLAHRICIVDEVESLTEVDHKRVLALPDEQSALSGAAGNIDVVDKLPGIGVVTCAGGAVVIEAVRSRAGVAERLATDIVGGLGEDLGSAAGVGDEFWPHVPDESL